MPGVWGSPSGSEHDVSQRDVASCGSLCRFWRLAYPLWMRRLHRSRYNSRFAQLFQRGPTCEVRRWCRNTPDWNRRLMAIKTRCRVRVIQGRRLSGRGPQRRPDTVAPMLRRTPTSGGEHATYAVSSQGALGPPRGTYRRGAGSNHLFHDEEARLLLPSWGRYPGRTERIHLLWQRGTSCRLTPYRACRRVGAPVPPVRRIPCLSLP